MNRPRIGLLCCTDFQISARIPLPTPSGPPRGRGFFPPRWGGGRVNAPPLQAQKSPVSGETGDFHYILFVPIRRAETVRSVQRRITRVLLVFRKAPCRTVWLPALPGDRSGGFTRVTSSTTHQARVCPQGLPAKIPRFRRTGGFRYLSMTSAVRPTVFYSSFDKQRVGQFASGGSPLTAGGQRRPEPCPRRCRCTSRSS